MAEIEQKREKDPEESKTQDTADMEISVPFLEHGSLLVVVRSSGRRVRRYFRVDTAAWTLAYSNPLKCWMRSREHKIHIKNIAEIHDDEQNPADQQGHKPSFTIVFGERMETLHITAPNADVKNKWVHGLRFLVRERSVKDPAKQERMWLEECFAKADKNHDGTVDKDEIVSVLKSLNVSSEVTKFMR